MTDPKPLYERRWLLFRIRQVNRMGRRFKRWGDACYALTDRWGREYLIEWRTHHNLPLDTPPLGAREDQP